MSKSIIDAHSGEIWAENNADRKGATFPFTLSIIDNTEPENTVTRNE